MMKKRKKDSAVPYEFIQEVNKMAKDDIVKTVHPGRKRYSALKRSNVRITK